MDGAALLTTLAKAHVGEAPASEAEVLAGLRSPDGACRDLAIELAGRDHWRHAPAMIEAWFRWPGARPRLQAALRRDPLLALESLRPPGIAELPPPPAGGLAIERWFSAERAARAVRAFAEGERSGADGGALLDALLGLHQLVATSPEVGEARRAAHAARLTSRMRDRYPPQIGVIPSFRCNRSCEYCFSSQRQHPGRADMTIEGFRALLDVVAGEGGARRVNLFGGEPTFFPGAAGFVRELERRDVRFYFATNGVGPEEGLRTLLDSPALLHVTLHVEPRDSYSDDEWRALLRTARAIQARPVGSVIRFNLTSPDEASWEQLDPFVAALPRAHLSFAVVFPAQDRQNLHVGLDQLFRFGPTIARFSRWARRRWGDPTLVLAKPFPLCAFSEADLDEALASLVELHNICEIRRSGFTDQAMVHPDLTVAPCMAVTAPPYREPAPLPLSVLGERFAERLGPLVANPILERCRSCRLHAVGACQAACYAYAQ